MELTKREMSDGSWGRRFLILIGIGLMLGWMGPFGTYDSLALPQRFAFWGVSVPLIGLVARFVIRLAVRHAPLAHLPLAARVVVGALLTGFPGAFIIYALLSAIHRPFPFDIIDLLGTYFSVTALTMLFGLPMAFVARRRLEGVEPAAIPPTAETVSSFFKRLPPKLGTDLLSLTAEDHYVRVTTALGSDLVLIRLSDAIAEIGTEKGQRVHRSHWVAQGAVASVDRQNGKTAFVLTNGEVIPVSQSYVAALREAGWL